jgi:hypothetical protein
MQEPKYTTHNIDDSIPMKTNKSSFKGKVKATFTQLVALFGKPQYTADPDEKVNWWWAVEFADGTIATIYNWKTSFEYGFDPEQVDGWNVGGFCSDAVHNIDWHIGMAKHEGIE